MAKKKLIRFKQIEEFPHVAEPAFDEILGKDYNLKGNWSKSFFGNSHPIVLELACGKGEYTVALAKAFPNINFLGLDIKGSRIWYGAQQAIDENIPNAKFLRTRIDLIESFFGENEIDEIWITFPDPQPQESREKKRLTSDRFLNRYRQFLKPNGAVNLKHDSNSFYQYTLEQIGKHGFKLHHRFDDVYNQIDEIPEKYATVYKVQTHYEKLFAAKGHVIKFVSFSI